MKPEFKAENIQVKNLKNLNHKNVSVVEELKYQIQEIIFVNLVTVNITVILTKLKKYQIYNRLENKKLNLYLRKFVKLKIQ